METENNIWSEIEKKLASELGIPVLAKAQVALLQQNPLAAEHVRSNFAPGVKVMPYVNQGLAVIEDPSKAAEILKKPSSNAGLPGAETPPPLPTLSTPKPQGGKK